MHQYNPLVRFTDKLYSIGIAADTKRAAARAAAVYKDVFFSTSYFSFNEQ